MAEQLSREKLVELAQAVAPHEDPDTAFYGLAGLRRDSTRPGLDALAYLVRWPSGWPSLGFAAAIAHELSDWTEAEHRRADALRAELTDAHRARPGVADAFRVIDHLRTLYALDLAPSVETFLFQRLVPGHGPMFPDDDALQAAAAETDLEALRERLVAEAPDISAFVEPHFAAFVALWPDA